MSSDLGTERQATQVGDKGKVSSWWTNLTWWGQLLGVLTAFLTLITTALGVAYAGKSSNVNDLQSTVDRQRAQIAKDQSELDALATQLAESRRALALATAVPAPESPDTAGDTATTLDNPGVYRQGKLAIVFNGGSPDFDAPPSDPQWGMGGNTNSTAEIDHWLQELHTQSGGLQLSHGSWAQIHAAKPGYTDCVQETSYRFVSIPVEDVTPGAQFCFRTGEGRYALMLVKKVAEERLDTQVTVYNKPS